MWRSGEILWHEFIYFLGHIGTVRAFNTLSLLEGVNLGAGGLLDQGAHRQLQKRQRELQSQAFGYFTEEWYTKQAALRDAYAESKIEVVSR
jgi:hypothetical protein